jgi:hypothetical protein
MIVTRKSLSRRTMLRGLGAALALPLLDGMIPALVAQRKTAAAPIRRFGAVYVPNGMLMSQWTPATEGVGFEFSPTLKSLEPFRDAVRVISGLNVSENAGASLHSRASTRWLTGVPPREIQSQAGVAAEVSMDQIAARAIGHHTPLPSLEVALEPNDFAGSCDPGFSCTYVNTIAWRGPRTPLPMEHNPRVLFERLFGESGTTDPAARLARTRKNRSILDSVAAEATSLSRTLGPGDRLKLTEYLEAVRDIEQRLGRAEQRNAQDVPRIDQPASVPASYEEYAKLMIDLQVLAYQSDLTRISTFMLGRELSGRQYPEIGAPDAHHPSSHHQNDATKQANYARINAHHTQLFAYYVERLKATREGDGTLLDQVAILYGAGMADGNAHSTQDLPLVLVGGAAGKGGRHVRYAADTPIPNLHLALLDWLGAPTERLGNSTGTLSPLSLS